MKRYLEPLTKLIQEGKIDMTSLITHRSQNPRGRAGPLRGLPEDKKDGCVKVVFHL